MDYLRAAKHIQGVNVALTGDSGPAAAADPGIAVMALIELLRASVHVIKTPLASG